MSAKRLGWLYARNVYNWRLIAAAAVGVVVLIYKFWFVMVPMLGLAGLVAVFLRYSRPKDSL